MDSDSVRPTPLPASSSLSAGSQVGALEFCLLLSDKTSLHIPLLSTYFLSCSYCICRKTMRHHTVFFYLIVLQKVLASQVIPHSPDSNLHKVVYNFLNYITVYQPKIWTEYQRMLNVSKRKAAKLNILIKYAWVQLS